MKGLRIRGRQDCPPVEYANTVARYVGARTKDEVCACMKRYLNTPGRDTVWQLSSAVAKQPVLFLLPPPTQCLFGPLHILQNEDPQFDLGVCMNGFIFKRVILLSEIQVKRANQRVGCAQ